MDRTRRREAITNLVQALNTDPTVVMVGAGVTRALGGQDWHGLLLEIAAEMNSTTTAKPQLSETGNADHKPAHVYRFEAQSAAKDLIKRWPTTMAATLILRQFNQHDNNPISNVIGKLNEKIEGRIGFGGVHHAIARLPTLRYVTTNYDKSLVVALQKYRGLDPDRDVYEATKPGHLLKYLERIQDDLDRPAVLHLHGRTKYVIDEPTYDLHYSNPETLTLLRSLLLTNRFMFVGASLHDTAIVQELFFARKIHKSTGERDTQTTSRETDARHFVLLCNKIDASGGNQSVETTSLAERDGLADMYGLQVVPFDGSTQPSAPDQSSPGRKDDESYLRCDDSYPGLRGLLWAIVERCSNQRVPLGLGASEAADSPDKNIDNQRRNAIAALTTLGRAQQIRGVARITNQALADEGSIVSKDDKKAHIWLRPERGADNDGRPWTRLESLVDCHDSSLAPTILSRVLMHCTQDLDRAYQGGGEALTADSGTTTLYLPITDGTMGFLPTDSKALHVSILAALANELTLRSRDEGVSGQVQPLKQTLSKTRCLVCIDIRMDTEQVAEAFAKELEKLFDHNTSQSLCLIVDPGTAKVFLPESLDPETDVMVRRQLAIAILTAASQEPVTPFHAQDLLHFIDYGDRGLDGNGAGNINDHLFGPLTIAQPSPSGLRAEFGDESVPILNLVGTEFNEGEAGDDTLGKHPKRYSMPPAVRRGLMSALETACKDQLSEINKLVSLVGLFLGIRLYRSLFSHPRWEDDKEALDERRRRIGADLATARLTHWIELTTGNSLHSEWRHYTDQYAKRTETKIARPSEPRVAQLLSHLGQSLFAINRWHHSCTVLSQSFEIARNHYNEAKVSCSASAACDERCKARLGALGRDVAESGLLYARSLVHMKLSTSSRAFSELTNSREGQGQMDPTDLLAKQLRDEPILADLECRLKRLQKSYRRQLAPADGTASADEIDRKHEEFWFDGDFVADDLRSALKHSHNGFRFPASDFAHAYRLAMRKIQLTAAGRVDYEQAAIELRGLSESLESLLKARERQITRPGGDWRREDLVEESKTAVELITLTTRLEVKKSPRDETSLLKVLDTFSYAHHLIYRKRLLRHAIEPLKLQGELLLLHRKPVPARRYLLLANYLARHFGDGFASNYTRYLLQYLDGNDNANDYLDRAKLVVPSRESQVGLMGPFDGLFPVNIPDLDSDPIEQIVVTGEPFSGRTDVACYLADQLVRGNFGQAHKNIVVKKIPWGKVRQIIEVEKRNALDLIDRPSLIIDMAPQVRIPHENVGQIYRERRGEPRLGRPLDGFFEVHGHGYVALNARRAPGDVHRAVHFATEMSLLTADELLDDDLDNVRRRSVCATQLHGMDRRMEYEAHEEDAVPTT